MSTSGEENGDFKDYPICVIGAGGLGCELLKNLALLGFRNIHVIDMDTIDAMLKLMRMSDVGKSKAEVAAKFVMSRTPGCTVTPYFGKIQDKDEEYYSQFMIIICGLDSVEARRWMNATVIGLYDEEDPSTMIPLIDGGTEGFKGQSRVIIPKQTACYECSLDMQTKPKTYPASRTLHRVGSSITVANVFSRLAQTYADKKLDGDDPDHVNWIFKKATERANEFKIAGVTYSMTQGVIKNIIPAIASTNAIVAASSANEAYKLATEMAPIMNNYMMYVGDSGVYTFTFPLEKKDNCPVCGSAKHSKKIPKTITVQELIDMLLEMPEIQLKSPSLRTGRVTIYMQAPPSLEQQTRPNLQKLVSEMVDDGEEIIVTDRHLPITVQLKIKFE